MYEYYFCEVEPAIFQGIGEVFTGIGMVTGPALGGFLYAVGGLNINPTPGEPGYTLPLQTV